MVIDDLDDFRFVGTGDGLGKFIVIHQHELHAWQIDQV